MGDTTSQTPAASLPVTDGNDEFPVPFDRFSATLVHTADEVYIGLLRINHGRENRKMSNWRELIDNYRNTAAHEHHPDYRG